MNDDVVRYFRRLTAAWLVCFYLPVMAVLVWLAART